MASRGICVDPNRSSQQARQMLWPGGPMSSTHAETGCQPDFETGVISITDLMVAYPYRGVISQAPQLGTRARVKNVN